MAPNAHIRGSFSVISLRVQFKPSLRTTALSCRSFLQIRVDLMKLQFALPTGSELRLQVVKPAQLVACAGPQCVYLAHSQQLFNGFCCGRCRLSPGTGHGPQCEMREDPRRVGAIEPKAAEPEAAGPEHAQTLTIGPVAPVEMATLGLRVVLAARAQELGAVQSCTQMDQTAGHSEVRPLDGELGTYEGRLETDLTLQLMNAVRIARWETEMCRRRAAKHEASMHTIERELRAELSTALATDAEERNNSSEKRARMEHKQQELHGCARAESMA